MGGGKYGKVEEEHEEGCDSNHGHVHRATSRLCNRHSCQVVDYVVVSIVMKRHHWELCHVRKNLETEATIFICIIYVAVDVVKERMQVQQLNKSDISGKCQYTGGIDTFRGIRGIYREYVRSNSCIVLSIFGVLFHVLL